jgi:hypothetical protein
MTPPSSPCGSAWNRAARVVAAVLCTFACGAHAADTPRRPLEHFARLPQLSRVALSPDGERIAALFNDGHDTAVITRAAKGNAARWR